MSAEKNAENYDIIDFHVHPFYDKSNNFSFYESTVTDWETFGKVMKNAGIRCFCGSVIRRIQPKSFEDISKLNEEALLLREKFNGSYIPGIAVHPDFVEESIEEIKKYSAKSIKLIGELTPYLMGWKQYYSSEMHSIYEEADKQNMVVSFHSNSDGTLEPTVEEALKRFPGITFVAAHPREKELFNIHIERMKKYDNYYLDISGTGIARWGLLKYGVSKVGSEKFLFGTDFPINNPKMYVEGVLFEDLKEQDYINIFSANAKRILGI